MELLIAATISIMMMGATVTLFGIVGDRISGARAMIEVADRLRSAQNLLRNDLIGHTVCGLPWEQPSAGSGYFEILKGRSVRNNRDSQPGSANVLLGYTQDAIMFTTRSPNQSFTGRFVINGNPTTVESPVAEVVWFLWPTFNVHGQRTIPPTYTLYRRQFLILPSLTPLKVGTGKLALRDYYDRYDVSVHPDGKGNVDANSLADLTYRENRFAHEDIAPFAVNFDPLQPAPTPNDYNAYSLTPFQPPFLFDGSENPIGSQRYGEDVVLTNVLSFDVKLWDPGAAVLPDSSQLPLVPSDPGYTNEFNNWTSAKTPPVWNNQPVQYGAYVDLYYAETLGSVPPSSYFAGTCFGAGQKSAVSAGDPKTQGFATFDTWSQGYEYYMPGADASSFNRAGNGFDDDGANGVDDANERISSPPYPVPLRGLQIKIRVYEPVTRQVREITTSETFVPD